MPLHLDKQSKIYPKESVWQNPAIRSVVFQFILIFLVVGTGYYFFNNALNNLERQGIASGFDFLKDPAGFDIIMHLVDYNEQSSYFTAFIVGLLNTLILAFLGIIFATMLGFIIGIARLSKNFILNKIAAAYIETFRNIPLLLQIFFWYFAILRHLPHPRHSITPIENIFINIRGIYIPSPIPKDIYDIFFWITCGLIIIAIIWARYAKIKQINTGKQLPVFWPTILGFIFILGLLRLILGSPFNWEYPVLRGFNFTGGIVIIPELIAMIVALSIYTASFLAEMVRAGILAVNYGQTEAAYSLGLSRNRTMSLVIIPQALRVIIPPLTSQYLNLTKNSSLAAAIAYPDLVSVFAGTVLNQTGQAIEVIGITMTIYLSISLIISMFMNWYNKRIALVER